MVRLSERDWIEIFYALDSKILSYSKLEPEACGHVAPCPRRIASNNGYAPGIREGKDRVRWKGCLAPRRCLRSRLAATSARVGGTDLNRAYGK